MPSYSSNNPFKRTIRPTAVITIGDPFGIGPEIVLKALASRKIKGLADFLIIGDATVLSAAADTLKIKLKPEIIGNLYDLKLIAKGDVRFGRPCAFSGKASLAYLNTALEFIKNKKADCLITAPVSKEAISAAGVKFSGHTEYIAEAFKTKRFAMMLIGGPLKVTLVTRHIPISAVADTITEDEILKCIELSYHALKTYFRISRPRIGVTSVNPHGGEGGFIGREEERVIKPAVDKARGYFGENIVGPVSSEALFYQAFRKRLDCVIAMYHDQALTALKMIARDESVNVTLGIPFARTSPGHGTAFDIAGKGLANAASMIEAMKLAVAITNRGLKYNEL